MNCLWTVLVGGLLATAAQKEKPEPDWARKFREAYQLVPGQLVKRVGPPYIPERIDFQLVSLARGREPAGEVDDDNRRRAAAYAMWTTVLVEQDGTKLRMLRSLSSAYLEDHPELRQGDNLLTVWEAVTHVTGLESPEVAIDPASKDHPLFAPKNKTVHGDFVTRKDAPLAKMLPQLEAILRVECKIDVRLTLKDEEQTVFVAGGAFKAKPPAWRPKGHFDIYATDQVLDKEYDHFDFKKGRKNRAVQSLQYGGSPAEFVRFVGDRIRTRIVWDAPLPDGPRVEWYNHVQRTPTPEEEAADRDPEKVLKVVAEQTGLTFKKEKRKVPVLYLSAPPK